jgi:hypothetical protein
MSNEMNPQAPSENLHKYVEQGIGEWSEDLLYIMQRLRNPGKVGEGSAVVPRLTGFLRVPYPRNFKVLSTTGYKLGTEFILSWTEPEDFADVARYNVYAINTIDANPIPVVVGTSRRSPCTARVTSSVAGTIIFYIQTVLTNGYSNDLNSAPTCTGTALAPGLDPDDLADNSITKEKLEHAPTGNLISYDASTNPYYLAPSVVDALLTSNATGNILSYKTWDSLYLTRNKSTTKSANFTVDSLNDVYLIDTSSTSITATLPATTTRKTPVRLVKTKEAGSITVTPNGSDTINGETGMTILFKNSAMELLPIGTDWRVI